MKTNNTKHGSGGAHLGAFGRSIMFCAPEGDGAGAGSGGGESTDTTTATTTTGDPAPAPAAAASEKMLPQSQVSTLIATAKREAREAARREFEPKPKEPAAPAAAASTGMMSPTDVQQLIARERAFERGASGIDGGRLSRMEAAFRADAPTDVMAWTKAYREDMGFDAKSPASPAAPAAQTAATTEAPKPAAAPGAPSTHALPTANGVIDLFAMSPAQHQALGPAKVRETLEALWKIGNQMGGAPERPKPPQR